MHRFNKHANNDVAGLIESLRRRRTPEHLVEVCIALFLISRMYIKTQLFKQMVNMIIEYANSSASSTSSVLTTKDVAKITDKIFKVNVMNPPLKAKDLTS